MDGTFAYSIVPDPMVLPIIEQDVPGHLFHLVDQPFHRVSTPAVSLLGYYEVAIAHRAGDS